MKLTIKTAVPIIVFICSALILSSELNYEKYSEIGPASKFADLQIPFVSNKGQVDESVEFYAQILTGTVFVTNEGDIVYSFPGTEKVNRSEYTDNCDKFYTGLALKEKFIGGEISRMNGLGNKDARISYFVGAEESKWKRNIPAYDIVGLGEVYEGIEIELRAGSNNIEKIFRIRPGYDPDEIAIGIEGADHLKVNGSGELEMETGIGTVSFTKPVAYQEHRSKRQPVPVEYIVDGMNYGFRLGDYDAEREVIIDPMISATFLGGSDADDQYEPTMVLDDDGNVYISGFTSSSDFPHTTGVYKTRFNRGSMDRFISKFNNDLSELLASTFIGGRGFGGGLVGGNGADLGHGLTLDKEGNVYIAGYTESPDYPVTAGAYDAIYNGGRDVFVSKLDNDLSTLLSSTFIGGSGDEGFQWPRIDMTIDHEGNVYVAGITHSIDFPVKDNSYDKTFNGGLYGGDPFVVKLNSDLTSLMASSYLGGDGNEWRISVETDVNGNVFLCGESESSNFPTTSNAYDRSANPDENGIIKDIFLCRMSADLSTLYASTIFGDTKLEEALDMTVSDAGDIYIAGYTHSHNFPTTQGAYNREFSGGDRDAFVAKFDNDLEILKASTLFGGSLRDMIRGLELDDDGNICVTGVTLSLDFPVTEGTYNNDLKEGARSRRDAFITKISNDLSSLLVSGCFGGKFVDDGYSIKIDKNGFVFIAGMTTSEDFPATEGA
ncbi:MAG: hypothetical protein GY863_24020, partial [bacterium]|nr:hypothetical protein [bacterium]